MIRVSNGFGKSIAVLLTVSIGTMGFPMQVLSGLGASLLPRPAAKKPSAPESCLLTSKEMKKMQGRISTNPYIAGANKFDVIYKGVDLASGNFSTSATDLSFEGGYGIPVNVTRTYNANNEEAGPLGGGWSLSVDIRSTAGGLLKSSGAPVRSVPVMVKEKPVTQTDPNVNVTSPPEGVTMTDASGQEETVQRDADGILTTPPWDKNINDSEYEKVIVGDDEFWVLKKNTVTTPDGTVYVYDKHGYYGYDGTGTGMHGIFDDDYVPSNILKPTTVTDRNGNVTTYHYDTTHTISFGKINGVTIEDRLISIEMPSGHKIVLNWKVSTTWMNRVQSVYDTLADGTTPYRTVAYGYNEGDVLTSVTTPEGKETVYGYEPAADPEDWSGSVATVLHTITDPRGLVTTIDSTMPSSDSELPSVRVTKITAPNGIQTVFNIAPTSGGGGMTGIFHDTTDGTTAFAGGEVITDFSGGSSGGVVVTMREPLVPLAGDLLGGHNNYWRRTYGYYTLDLTKDEEWNVLPRPVTQTNNPLFLADYSPWSSQKVTVDTGYNFLGSPLTTTVTEHTDGYSGGPTPPSDRETTSDFTYWGGAKYYQQKAIRTKIGSSSYRYAFSDYYDKDADAGKKGQTYRIYNSAFAHFTVSSDGQPTPPGGTDSSDYWKYYLRLNAGDTNNYSVQFDYDSQGRVKDVWKLQSTTGPVYVQTHSVYSTATNSWGNATDVYEDYGSGKFNRHTQTTSFFPDGSAETVVDATGRVFTTDKSLDGEIRSVLRTDTDPDVTVVQCGYFDGSSGNGISKYQVQSITDGLSGVEQTFSYTASGGGKGQVASITETDDSSNNYTVSYEYADQGDRSKATYAMSNGTTRWRYDQYCNVGSPDRCIRAFARMTKLDSSSNPTSEQFHYDYDSSGKLLNAAFNQTPSSGSDYSTTDPASSRARAFYAYDAGGRILSVEHYWDVWNTSNGGSNKYDSTKLVMQACAYDAYLGLKTQADLSLKSPGANTWTLDHSEIYAYDSNLDQLTSASYNGGTSSTTWSYDAAGNRNDATVVDNLNRATTIGGVTRTYDDLGNTTAIGSTKSMTWDVLNRMSSYTSGSTTTSYAYRADGLRIKKAASSSVYALYGYDGQMPVEEFNYQDSYPVRAFIKLIRYGLGPRGIDRIERQEASGTLHVGYPIYDAHGNMIATIDKTSSTPSLNDQRQYDVWGGVRAGNTTGEPNGRYCANLGHLQDDESGLLYMRARYCDPGAGRFISEDPAMSGYNWFAYCDNDPVSNSDSSGTTKVHIKDRNSFDFWMAMGMLSFGNAALLLMNPIGRLDPKEKAAAYILIGSAALAFAEAFGTTNAEKNGFIEILHKVNWITTVILGIMAAMESTKYRGFEKIAVLGFAVEATILLGQLIGMQYD